MTIFLTTSMPKTLCWRNASKRREKMVWILIAIIVISLWMVSLTRVLYSSCVPTRPAFLSKGSNKSGSRSNVLLVVAHPDDESMFFTPTILFLNSEGHNMHILCLSTGNADGKGFVRGEEFLRACATLKIRQVNILDDPNLQDGFEKQWNHGLIAKLIEEEVEKKAIDVVISFDNLGVSGHPNHRDVHHGICMVIRENARDVEAWELVTTSILRKYSGPIDIWLSILCTRTSYPKGKMYSVLNNCPRTSFLAMAAHNSQWIWFRKLFVLFSSYTYMNTLRKIEVS